MKNSMELATIQGASGIASSSARTSRLLAVECPVYASLPTADVRRAPAPANRRVHDACCRTLKPNIRATFAL